MGFILVILNQQKKVDATKLETGRNRTSKFSCDRKIFVQTKYFFDTTEQGTFLSYGHFSEHYRLVLALGQTRSDHFWSLNV
jgi:hypothetical protein